jgi:hypothetical protein
MGKGMQGDGLGSREHRSDSVPEESYSMVREHRKLIREESLPCSIEQFGKVMKYLRNRHPPPLPSALDPPRSSVWVGRGDCSEVRGFWALGSGLSFTNPAGYGVIEVFLEVERPKVQFWDCCDATPKHEPRPCIGRQPVEAFAEEAMEEARRLASGRPTGDEPWQADAEFRDLPIDPDMKRKLLDKRIMKQHYADYSPETAKALLLAIPKAWEKCSYEDARWGPGMIAKLSPLTSPTVGRYLKAFKAAGLTNMGDIPIPHSSRTSRQ